MKNICLIIEYLGKNYCGYQKQKNGISIQQVLEQAIESALSQKVTTYASGRTDSGVNAFGQVVNFETTTTIAPEKIAICINRHLPDDIRVLKSFEVDKDFNSRFSAKSKTYEYIFVINRPLSVFEIGRAAHCSYKLDYELLDEACQKILGEHDFSSFMASKSNIKENTVRTINAFYFEKSGDTLIFTIEGNGFLYNMVRIIVGTVIDIARGAIDIKVLDEMFKGNNRKLGGKTAPAEGLYLKEVEY